MADKPATASAPPPAAETVLSDPPPPVPSTPDADIAAQLAAARKALSDEQARHADTDKAKKQREVRISELEDIIHQLRAAQSGRPPSTSVPASSPARGGGFGFFRS